MSMTVMIAHASKDEHGTFRGGAAGDQTGQEVVIRSWYNRPWNVVLRAKDTSTANKIAEAMERACKNDHIGYDQNQRNTALTEARKVAYDPGRITKDVETDCSALVSLACMYAGIPEAALFMYGNSATTSTLRSRLLKTGKFTELTARAYTGYSDKLVRGDILLYEGHHVAVVVSAQPSIAINSANSKSIDSVARAIIAGKYPNGVERTTRLRAEGFTDAEIGQIQTRVNQLLKK